MALNPEQKDSFAALAKALDRFAEALEEDQNSNTLAIDGSIQRFEFCVELTWENLKRFLEIQGKVTKTPKQALQEAYAIGWITDEAVWLSMLEDRNLTSHTYNDDTANDIYSKLQEYYQELKQLYKLLKALA